ncbi:MAG: phosphate/phosphite/phosphonate ABC transporter substrate-binding protein [Magnetococcus sp. YQC-3]
MINLIALLLGWLLVGAVAEAAPVPLTLGSISSDPAKEIRRFLPVAQHLAEQLAPQGIGKGQVVVAADMREMAALLKSGRVDVYIDSPLTSVVVNQLAGSRMVLRRWKGGQAEYRTAIFVKKESPIQNLSQLAGKLVGFKDAYSSSGYLMPRIALEQAGLSLVDMSNLRTPVPADKVGYLFTNDRETGIFWVTMGKIAAGADSTEAIEKHAKGDRDKLRIIHETGALPRHVVNLRGDLPEPQAKALLQILLTMDQNESGKQILAKFEQTARFDPIPPETQTQLQQMTPTILAILGEQP